MSPSPRPERSLKRRTFLTLTTSAVAAGLAACAATDDDGGGSSGTGQEAVVFHYGQTGFPSNDLTEGNGYGALKIIRNVYEGLVSEVLGTYDEIGPALATEWETDDNQAWTFHLRENVTFTDGTPFNAEAVAWNVERSKEVGFGSAAYARLIDTVETPDDHTVVLTLHEPRITFLQALAKIVIASPTAGQDNEVDGDYGQRWLDTNPVGTGPYVLQNFVADQSYELVRNDDYWGGWQEGQIDVIEVIKADENTAVQMLESGDIDKFDGPIGQYVERFSSNAELTVLEAPGRQIDYLHFNTQSYPTDNATFRQALSLAYDYAADLEAAYYGFGTLPQGPLPVEFSGFDASLPVSSQDLDSARELLEESGVPEADRTISITIMDGQTYQEAFALVFQDSLKQIGVDVVINKTTWAELAEAVSSPETAPHGTYIWIGAATGDPVDFLAIFTSEHEGSDNYAHYSNPEFDQAIEEAAAASDIAARDEAIARAQQIFVAEVPALVAAAPTVVEVISTRFTGYVVHPIDTGYTIKFYELRSAN